MEIYNKNMAPGIEEGKSFSYRSIFRGGSIMEFPGGIIVDGDQSRDPGNVGDEDVLRAGNIMGKLSSGKYAPSLVGLTTAAYVSGATALYVSAAVAAELLRRLGGTAGTLVIAGPPAASGVVAEIETTLSDIDTVTGELTITDLGANMIEGAIVLIKDGTETLLGLIFKPDGLKVTQPKDCTSIDVQTSLAVGGIVDSSQIVNWPADSSLQDWVADGLNAVGQFVFDHPYL